MSTRFRSQAPAYRRQRRDHYQEMTAQAARRHGEPWTLWDDYALLYGEGRLVDRALEIQRTYHACVLRRQQLLDAIREGLRAAESADLVT